MIPELDNISDGEIVLLIVDVDKYHKAVLDIVNFFCDEKKGKGVFISISRSYERLKNTFKKGNINIDRLFFVDVVSKIVGLNVEDSDRCIFIEDPTNLVDISVNVQKLLCNINNKNKFLVFDSISGLLLYNKPISIERFIHSFCCKMRSWNITGIIISIKGELKEDMITTISGFCDRTINI